MMLRVQEQGYKSLAQFGGRAFTYVSNFVMQTAIKVRTKHNASNMVMVISNLISIVSNADLMRVDCH